MSNDGACSAYIAGPHLCANGFPQNAACMGARCHCCGRHTEQVPACLRDEVPAHLVDESGKPRLIKTIGEVR